MVILYPGLEAGSERGDQEKRKLEMDRRLIRKRIGHLSKELKQVVKHREVQRQKRSKNHVPVVCIAGYTNAGKSTLLNLYTDAGVLEEDQFVCNAGSDDKIGEAAVRAGNFTDGYGRLYPKTSASSCECVSKHLGRGKVQRSDPACR